MGDQLLESLDGSSGRNGRSRASTTSAGGTWSASGGQVVEGPAGRASRGTGRWCRRGAPGPSPGRCPISSIRPRRSRVRRACFGVDPADLADLAPRHRLPVGHHGQRLQRRPGEPGGAGRGGEPLQDRAEVGAGVEPPAAADLPQHEAAAARRQALRRGRRGPPTPRRAAISRTSAISPPGPAPRQRTGSPRRRRSAPSVLPLAEHGIAWRGIGAGATTIGAARSLLAWPRTRPQRASSSTARK